MKFFNVICYMLNVMYCICYIFLWVGYDCWWCCVPILPCSALFCNEHMIALIRSYSIDEMIEAGCSIEWHVFQSCSIFAEASIDQMIETYRTMSGCSMTELPYHGMWPALSWSPMLQHRVIKCCHVMKWILAVCCPVKRSPPSIRENLWTKQEMISRSSTT